MFLITAMAPARRRRRIDGLAHFAWVFVDCTTIFRNSIMAWPLKEMSADS